MSPTPAPGKLPPSALPEAPGAADAAGELHGEEDKEDEEAEEGNRNGGERYRRAAEDAPAAEGADHFGDEAVKKLHQLIFLLEHRAGIEPANTDFADQRVSHFAIGAHSPPRPEPRCAAVQLLGRV